MKLRLGIVVIGRNEGERLVRCLRSIRSTTDPWPLVYADSGSTDGSLATARAIGVDVIEVAAPFTAARGRNEGYARLLERHPDLDVVQFLDGDTELSDGWLQRGLAELALHVDAAAVCGRRRERFPHASPYNMLCDLEWDTPVGEASAFGGDVMIRVEDLQRVGGYDATLVAGEDPDLALRLRRSGRKVVRVDHEMTLHDAGLTRFPQFWRRAVRGGHAFAEGADRNAADGFWAHEVHSNWMWGAALPAAAIGMFLPTLGGSAFIAGAGYATLFAKLMKDARSRGLASREARMYAALHSLAKVAQAAGQAKYWWSRMRRKQSDLIEYKGPGRRGPGPVGAVHAV